MTNRNNLILSILSIICGCYATEVDAADPMLVANGKAQAEIVIAPQPSRSARLAVHELKSTLQKISGAKLPIVTEPTKGQVHILVGRSSHTDELGITDQGLDHGAYRIVSGKDWLVLIGDDEDFVPREPWARNNGDRASGKLQRQWKELTSEPFGVPNGGMYKNRARLPGDIGKPDGATTEKGEMLEVWSYDERGSFNAVCG